MEKSVILMSQEELRAHWKSIMFEGVTFTILGILALIVPGLFSLTFELVVGWLFLIGGALQLYRAIQSNGAPGFWMFIISALLSMVFGVLMVFNPLAGLVALTMIIAIFFLLEGIVKIIYAFQIQAFASWGWILLSGFCSILIAMMVFSGWPLSTSWFIGTLIGVYLIMNGVSLMMISWRAHQE
jgi:uncharacterized membrane protein HdeD (DUF308 family)